MKTYYSRKFHVGDGEDYVVIVAELRNDGTATLNVAEFSPPYTDGVAYGYAASPATQSESSIEVSGDFEIVHEAHRGPWQPDEEITTYRYRGGQWHVTRR